jgi:hypothetical protein
MGCIFDNSFLWTILVSYLSKEKIEFLNKKFIVSRFTPWGYINKLPYDYNDLFQKAGIAVNAINSVYGSKFKVGSSANLLCIKFEYLNCD